MSDSGSERDPEETQGMDLERVDLGEENGEGVYDEEDDAHVAPIAALPPKVVLQEESQMEVSSSPAFQCLDDVS